MGDKKPTIEEYAELAKMCIDIRLRLLEISLHASLQCNAPKSVTKSVDDAARNLNRFTSDMEDRFFSQYSDLPDEALDIFYPRFGDMKRSEQAAKSVMAK